MVILRLHGPICVNCVDSSAGDIILWPLICQAMAADADARFQHARDLVDAQQARSILDYLVGFNLSPFLWKKIRYGLSAGRVQSVALRLICERENEIEAFKPREYWSIEADVNKEEQPFSSRLVRYRGEKVEQFSFENEAQARDVEKTLLDAADGKLTTVTVNKRQRRRNPAAPFTTSTLQQESSRKLGFNTQWTMRVAQKLYEGIELPGEGNVGLISYMRTDSVTLAGVAVDEIREVGARKSWCERGDRLEVVVSLHRDHRARGDVAVGEGHLPGEQLEERDAEGVDIGADVDVKALRDLPNYAHVPILVLTTESGANKKMEGKHVGATGWLVKPFNPEKLLEVVSKVLD